MKKIILGIETSCDETSAAVLVKDGDNIKILSHVVASSAELQSKFGGIIPEQAAREQIKSIIPVIQEAIENCKLKIENLDAIAVTQGPGLIGSLLVGVETAKTLSLVWNKPLIPVNHLIGHFYANWIDNHPAFPCIGLLVSGGHTDLVLFKDHGKYEYLGGTRDDAAGECFDKSARLLGLPYPGGPQISKQAKEGDSTKFNLPRPMLDSHDYDFSFSGLKTAVSLLVANNKKVLSEKKDLADICATIEGAIVEVLVRKTIKAAKDSNTNQIIVAGGVAANQELISALKGAFDGEVISPLPILCTDNAAMIAAAAFFAEAVKDPLQVQANPNLSLVY